MIELLNTFISTVTLVIQSAINTITSTFSLISHIPTYANFLYTSIGLLPTSILPFASASVGIYVLLFILGRL